MNDLNPRAADASARTHVDILEMQNGFMKNFNYVIRDAGSRRAVIVDPAWQFDKIEQLVRSQDLRLDGVLLTHSHGDHIHLAAKVAEHYGCAVWMSQAEIAFANFSAPNLEAIAEDFWYFGDTRIDALATPGHTPGGMCFLIGDALFTGDTLFAEGCGLCFGDYEAGQLYDSLQKLMQLPNHTRVFPGHSYGVYPGQLLQLIKRDNMYLNFKRRSDFVAYRMRSGQSARKMFEFF